MEIVVGRNDLGGLPATLSIEVFARQSGGRNSFEAGEVEIQRDRLSHGKNLTLQ
jgi:hypothetical protein